MDQLDKGKPIKPLISKHLTTSNPDSHQISKRIKGLLGYSEHYKGNRVDYSNIATRYLPLRTRDYCKARELSLEIWDPMIQSTFLEKFFKSQKNLQIIRIKILTKEEHKGQILKRLCKILSKIGGLSRISIDFDKDQTKQAMPGLIKRVRSIRKLPKLKEFEVTVGGEQVLPFSVSLVKVGFDGERGSLTVKDLVLIQKLINKTSKINFLDTIRIDTKKCFVLPDKFLDALVFVISKLPNFRALDFKYDKLSNLPLGQTSNILDTLVKAPKFEILGLGLHIKGLSQISLLKHPLFKAKSLKRISLSLFLYKEVSPNEILNLLGGMPSLYEISLDFDDYITISDELAENLTKKISEITSLRKLKICFAISVRIGAKQAEHMVRSIFSMNFLEELDLEFPRNCFKLGEEDIQGLPRLKKANINLARWGRDGENEIKRIVEILGNCHQLRELNLVVHDSVHDHQGVITVLCESLRKLKELQVFTLRASVEWRQSSMTVDLMEELMKTLNKLRNLQDLMLFISLNPQARNQRSQDIRQALATSKKYRCFAMAF